MTGERQEFHATRYTIPKFHATRYNIPEFHATRYNIPKFGQAKKITMVVVVG